MTPSLSLAECLYLPLYFLHLHVSSMICVFFPSFPYPSLPFLLPLSTLFSPFLPSFLPFSYTPGLS